MKEFFAFCVQYNFQDFEFPVDLLISILSFEPSIPLILNIFSCFSYFKSINFLIENEIFIKNLQLLIDKCNENEDNSLDVLHIVSKLMYCELFFQIISIESIYQFLDKLVPKIPAIKVIYKMLDHCDMFDIDILYKILINHLEVYDELAKYKIMKTIIKIIELKPDIELNEKLIQQIPSYIQPFNQKLAQYAFQIASLIHPPLEIFETTLNFIQFCEFDKAAQAAASLLVSNYEYWKDKSNESEIIQILQNLEEIPFDCSVHIVYSLTHYLSVGIDIQNDIFICEIVKNCIESVDYFLYFIELIERIIVLNENKGSLNNELLEIVHEIVEDISDSSLIEKPEVALFIEHTAKYLSDE